MVSSIFQKGEIIMIIVRDLNDIDTIKNHMKFGDVLEIFNMQYGVGKFYFYYHGVLSVAWNSGDNMDACYDSEFFRDIRVALYEPDRYFVKLVEECEVENVRLEEDAVI